MDEKKCPLTYKGRCYTTPGFNEILIVNRCIGPECAWWVEDECAITKIAKELVKMASCYEKIYSVYNRAEENMSRIYSAAYGVPESKQ